MANSKIKQILVGTTTYDIEDAGAAHLSAANTFTGNNTFDKPLTIKPLEISEVYHATKIEDSQIALSFYTSSTASDALSSITLKDGSGYPQLDIKSESVMGTMGLSGSELTIGAHSSNYRLQASDSSLKLIAKYQPDFAETAITKTLIFPVNTAGTGTIALTSDIISSFNNFTLLTSKPSDWATNYDTYYKKGDFGFFHNLSDSTWAANKFYSAVPAEINIQTLTQPIKIQVSGTPGWGEYGGLNLSYGKAKLYGIDNTFDDNVGYIDISNGNLTSAVYNADFTLSHPAGGGYRFSVKDTSTLFSVGLNKSQAGDYAQQYYCNINAPLNVTQIHGFTQLTDQPSDWSTKYGSYYAGFDAFNGNSRFWGRDDGLYKSTNDILLNVGTGHKIKIAGLYGSLGTDEIRNSITLSNSGINLKHEITGATSTLDILPNNINIKSDGLKLSASNDSSYIQLGSVGTIDLKGDFPVTITSDAFKGYGSNMFKLTVSGQQAIGVDTFSTSSNNLIRFEMTPKFNTNKIRGMAGVDLSLPASAGTFALTSDLENLNSPMVWEYGSDIPAGSTLESLANLILSKKDKVFLLEVGTGNSINVNKLLGSDYHNAPFARLQFKVKSVLYNTDNTVKYAEIEALALNSSADTCTHGLLYKLYDHGWGWTGWGPTGAGHTWMNGARNAESQTISVVSHKVGVFSNTEYTLVDGKSYLFIGQVEGTIGDDSSIMSTKLVVHTASGREDWAREVRTTLSNGGGCQASGIYRCYNKNSKVRLETYNYRSSTTSFKGFLTIYELAEV